MLRLERRDAAGLGDIRPQLLDAYAEIYADRFGEVRPFPDAPAYDVMVLSLDT